MARDREKRPAEEDPARGQAEQPLQDRPGLRALFGSFAAIIVVVTIVAIGVIAALFYAIS